MKIRKTYTERFKAKNKIDTAQIMNIIDAHSEADKIADITMESRGLALVDEEPREFLQVTFYFKGEKS